MSKYINPSSNKNKIEQEGITILEGKEGALKKIILSLIFIISFISPFFRGLFFENEQLLAGVIVFITFILFCVYKLLKREYIFLKTPLDYASFAFAISYGISIFGSASFRTALQEWLKYFAFFLIFIMVSKLFTDYKDKIKLIWTLLLSALGVCVVGIDAFAGGHIVNFLNKIISFTGLSAALGLKDFFYSLYVGGRIYSTFQYPNTFAAYLMAIIIITISVSMVSQKTWEKLISGAIGFITTVAFILTISRGAYIIIPIALIIFICLVPKEYKVRCISNTITNLVPGLLFAAILAGNINSFSGKFFRVWGLLIIGIIVSALINLTADTIGKGVRRVKFRSFIVAIAILFAIFCGVTIFLFNATVPIELSHKTGDAENIASLVKTVSLNSDKDYILSVDVNAKMVDEKPNAYSIKVANLTQKNIMFGGSTTLANQFGKGTNGTKTIKIDFKVPKDSSAVQFAFSNTYVGTSVTYKEAKVIDKATGKTVKNIKLKYKYLPEVITSRFEQGFNSVNVIQRFVYFRDAFKIWSHHFIKGAGGGTWEYMYYIYQNYQYISSQTHNYYLQVIVESGLLGILALLAMIIGTFVALLKIYTKGSSANVKTIEIGLIAAVLSIMLHSFIDFNLSFMFMLLFVWTLLAMVNSSNNEDVESNFRIKVFNSLIEKCSKLKTIKVYPIIGVVIVLLVLIIPIITLASVPYGIKAKEAQDKKYDNTAMSYYRTASKLDPFLPEYKTNYAKLIAKKGTISRDEYNEALKYVSDAEKHSHYSTKDTAGIAQFYLSLGEFDKGLSNFDRLTSLRRLFPNQWESRVVGYYQVVKFYLDRKDYDKAYSYIDKALNIINEAKEINKGNLNPFLFTSSTMEYLEELRFIKDNINYKESSNIEPKTFKEIMDRIVLISYPDIDINLDGIPDEWSINSSDEMNIAIKDGVFIAEPKVAEGSTLTTRSVKFEPGKSYTAQMTLNNTADTRSIQFSISNTEVNNAELRFSNGVYTTVLDIPSNFNANNNSLVFKIDRKYEIKDFRIFEED